jgi:hypothetical protein
VLRHGGIDAQALQYGQPCNELSIKAPQRFADLLQDYGGG